MQIKSDELGYNWSWFSDPYDFSCHLGPYDMNEDLNLDLRPRATADKIQANIYDYRGFDVNYNFVNMLVKHFAYYEPDARFMSYKDFINIASKKIDKYFDQYYDRVVKNIHNNSFCPKSLIKRRNRFLGIDMSKSDDENYTDSEFWRLPY